MFAIIEGFVCQQQSNFYFQTEFYVSQKRQSMRLGEFEEIQWTFTDS